MTIQPTIGRKVWYRPSQQDIEQHGLRVLDDQQPLDATIAFVTTSRNIHVNVCDHDGNIVFLRGVHLRQPDAEPPAVMGYAEWMPYQAAKVKEERR